MGILFVRYSRGARVISLLLEREGVDIVAAHFAQYDRRICRIRASEKLKKPETCQSFKSAMRSASLPVTRIRNTAGAGGCNRIGYATWIVPPGKRA